MNDKNRYITVDDIEEIRYNPKSFHWNYAAYTVSPGSKPHVWEQTCPPETIVSSKVLKTIKLSSHAAVIVIYNEVLKKQWLGFDEYGLYLFGDEKIHNDYVMVAALGAALKDVNGYVAYRIYPEGSFILDEIGVSIHLPHSKGRFTGFSRGSLYPPDETRDKPIEKRSKTLYELIKSLGWFTPEIVLVRGKKERRRFDSTTTEEELSLFKIRQSELDQLQATAQRFLRGFKELADELDIPYRK